MSLHLDQRRHFEPRPIRFVAPESGTEIQDSPHDRQVAVDCPWTDPATEPRLHKGLQSVVMNTMQRKLPDVGIHSRQRACTPFQAALVLVLLQVLRRRLAKRALLSSAKEPSCPCRLQSTIKSASASSRSLVPVLSQTRVPCMTLSMCQTPLHKRSPDIRLLFVPWRAHHVGSGGVLCSYSQALIRRRVK